MKKGCTRHTRRRRSRVRIHRNARHGDEGCYSANSATALPGRRGCHGVARPSTLSQRVWEQKKSRTGQPVRNRAADPRPRTERRSARAPVPPRSKRHTARQRRPAFRHLTARTTDRLQRNLPLSGRNPPATRVVSLVPTERKFAQQSFANGPYSVALRLAHLWHCELAGIHSPTIIYNFNPSGPFVPVATQRTCQDRLIVPRDLMGRLKTTTTAAPVARGHATDDPVGFSVHNQPMQAHFDSPNPHPG